MLLCIFSFWPIMSLSTIFNDHWLLIFIVIHSIHRYIICKRFINVDFILVPYYMIHDIIYWDLIIFNNFRYLRFLWNRIINYVKWIFWDSTFSIRSSCILAPFLIQEFLSLELIGLPRFKRVFGTNKPTMLYACYEIISLKLNKFLFNFLVEI